jgi:AraC-like DNA-binding protein
MIPDHTRFEMAFHPAPSAGELSVIFSGEGDPTGGHKIGPAVHDYYLSHTILSGTGIYSVGGKRYKCQAGDTFFIFPGEPVSYEADKRDPWRYAWVAMQGSLAASLLAEMGITVGQPLVHGDSRRLLPLYRRIRRSLERMETPLLAELESSGGLRRLLAAFGTANRERMRDGVSAVSDIDRQVAQAQRLLSTHYAQAVSIDGLSRTYGYHRTHFSQMFKRATGLSPKQYLYKVRMERAETLLATLLPIEQVAASVGYNDALYFSKQFHKWSGSSPTAYRRALQVQHQS